MKERVEINDNFSLILLKNKLNLLCFFLFSQIIFANYLLCDTISLKDSVGKYPSNEEGLYISDNTVVTNIYQIYVKPPASRKQKAKNKKYNKGKTEKRKEKVQSVKEIYGIFSSNISFMFNQIKHKTHSIQCVTISVTNVNNFKKKLSSKTILYWLVSSLILLFILKKHILYIWGIALLLLIKRNFTRPPPYL